MILPNTYEQDLQRNDKHESIDQEDQDFSLLRESSIVQKNIIFVTRNQNEEESCTQRLTACHNNKKTQLQIHSQSRIEAAC